MVGPIGGRADRLWSFWGAFRASKKLRWVLPKATGTCKKGTCAHGEYLGLAKLLTLFESLVCHLRCPFPQVLVLGVLLPGGEGLDWHLGPVGWQKALLEAQKKFCGLLVSIGGFRCVFQFLLSVWKGMLDMSGHVMPQGGLPTVW